ncbi:MAG: IS4 family transposase [Verrucomicrobiae bacterium]|nr:IS4 family transposase [Verrucomicrobiae bacterium]
MAKHPAPQPQLKAQDLHRWRLIEDFKARLALAIEALPLDPTWSHPSRRLQCLDYLSLFLLGLLNPVVRTMRGLCGASQLERVQQEVSSRPVSLGSFSEAQSLVDPALLEQVFSQLAGEVAAKDGSPGAAGQVWLIQDGSLFDALPRMYWALWRRRGGPQNQVRLHLSLEMGSDSPRRARITPGRNCERAAWRTAMQPGEAYVGDRYYGEDYRLLGQLEEGGVAFVMRLREAAVLTRKEPLDLSEVDRQAGVLDQAWVWLGGKGHRLEQPLRVVWVQTPKEVLRLVTNLGPEELSAGEVALLYHRRWQVELFFRWLKCILGCRHWLAESPRGVAIELYLALIAALLLQLYTGQRPNRRMMELIQFYLMGVASLEELWAGLERERQRVARQKTR